VDAGNIVVSISDKWLAGALTLWLAGALPERRVLQGFGHGVAPADSVLFTPTDCLPEEAAEIRARGSRVVVLAPVSRPEEAARYARAGAEYIVMSVDNARLLSALQPQTILPM
jgi:hypothetical protein